MEDGGSAARRSRRGLLAAGLVAGIAIPRAARADYPDRPIRWIVPSPPGGGFDVLARLIAGPLGERLGQPLVIDNRAGAATIIGAEAAARAPADGYSVLSADNATLVFNPALYRRLPYDPDRDFRPIALMARFQLLLVTRPQSEITTAAALFDRARAAPDRLDYAIPGIGFAHHLAMERLLRATGTRMTQVPMRGMAAMLTELMSGRIETGIVDFASGNQAILTGQLRPLAVCALTRLPQLPAVPTMQEALGLPGFEAFAWQGMVVPRATPDPVAARLTQAMLAALGDPALNGRMRQIGLDPMIGGAEQLTSLIAAERATWQPLIRQLGIILD